MLRETKFISCRVFRLCDILLALLPVSILQGTTLQTDQQENTNNQAGAVTDWEVLHIQLKYIARKSMFYPPSAPAMIPSIAALCRCCMCLQLVCCHV
jgi:hypothetical protein